MNSIPRRKFLQASAAALSGVALGGCKSTQKPPEPVAATEPAHGLGAEEVDSPTAGREKEFVRALLHEADGSKLADERAKLFYARDMANDPIPVAIPRAAGRVRAGLPGEPIQLICRLKVPSFGEVYCYADNNGRGTNLRQLVAIPWTEWFRRRDSGHSCSRRVQPPKKSTVEAQTAAGPFLALRLQQ